MADQTVEESQTVEISQAVEMSQTVETSEQVVSEEQVVSSEQTLEVTENIEVTEVAVCEQAAPAPAPAQKKPKRYRGPPTQPQEVDYRKSYRDYIEVTWLPPSHSGGEYVSYYIEMSLLGSGQWSICNQKPTRFTQFVCNNCSMGEKYLFRVLV